MSKLRSLRILALWLVVLAGCVPATTAPPTAAVPGAGIVAPVTRAPSAPSSAPSPTAVPVGLTPVTLAMGYIPNVQFAPFYMAQSKGYFRDAGLAVTFRYGIETDLLKLVGTNQLQFMIGSGEEVILGRSQGLPVRYIMRWYRRFPVVLFAKASSGIRTPKDVEGKKVGLPGLYGASYVGWEALVYAAGIDASKVSLQSIGFTQGAAVSQGQVDAALDYVVSGPVQLGQAGTAITVMPVSDYVDLPSNGLITNDAAIAGNPELVQALVSAILRGLAATLADPDAAFQASIAAVPEAGGEQTKISRMIFDESVKLWRAEPGTLGRSDAATWANAAVFMRKMGLIASDVAPTDLYTNRFAPGQ